jgi:hypothetical protein
MLHSEVGFPEYLRMFRGIAQVSSGLAQAGSGLSTTCSGSKTKTGIPRLRFGVKIPLHCYYL